MLLMCIYFETAQKKTAHVISHKTGTMMTALSAPNKYSKTDLRFHPFSASLQGRSSATHPQVKLVKCNRLLVGRRAGDACR